MPLPETLGFGSIEPITTFFTPVFAISCAHDPVLPTWLHGSRVHINVNSEKLLNFSPRNFLALEIAFISA
jgi:hypothetical protein